MHQKRARKGTKVDPQLGDGSGSGATLGAQSGPKNSPKPIRNANGASKRLVGSPLGAPRRPEEQFFHVFVIRFALFRHLSFVIVFELLTSHYNVYTLLCVFICVLRFFSCFHYCLEQTQNEEQTTHQTEFEKEPK